MNISYVKGRWVESAAAQIAISERGFRFGDGVFETIPMHAGRLYLWEYHIERLQAGLAALFIEKPACDLRSLALELARKNTMQEALLRLSVSRGMGGRGYLPDAGMQPTVVLEMFERPAPLAIPVTLWRSVYEKISPTSLPTGCKLSQGVNATLARMEAAGNHCHDALQRDARGHIAEASSSNIFWLAKGTLHTPSLESGALAGVTRRRIMELSPYPVREGLYTLEHLAASEAVVLTNAAQGIVAVNALLPDGIQWESGRLAEALHVLRQNDITSLAPA